MRCCDCAGATTTICGIGYGPGCIGSGCATAAPADKARRQQNAEQTQHRLTLGQRPTLVTTGRNKPIGKSRAVERDHHNVVRPDRLDTVYFA